MKQPVLNIFAPQPSSDRRWIVRNGTVTVPWNEPLRFDGETYEPALDQPRLSGQMLGVFALMSDGQWRTLAEIKAEVGGSEAGISARLRDLRKRRFGSHQIERRRVGDATGQFEYRVNNGLSAIPPHGEAADQ